LVDVCRYINWQYTDKISRKYTLLSKNIAKIFRGPGGYFFWLTLVAIYLLWTSVT